MKYRDAAAVTHEALPAVAFACSPRVCVGFLLQSKVMQVWLIGNSKFPPGVNGCLSPCVHLVRNSWATSFYITISSVIEISFPAKLKMQVVQRLGAKVFVQFIVTSEATLATGFLVVFQPSSQSDCPDMYQRLFIYFLACSWTKFTQEPTPIWLVQ